MGEFLTTDKIKEVLGGLPQEQRKAALQKLVERGHEIEGFNAEFSPFETLKNVPGSTLEFGKAIYNSVRHIDQTASALSSLGKGTVKKFVEALGGNASSVINPFTLKPVQLTDSDEEIVDAMGNFFVERYGSVDRLLNTIEKDPAGFLSDASTLLGGGGALIKGTATVSRLGKVAKAGDVISKYSRFLEPTTAAIKTARGLNEKLGINSFFRRSSNRFMAKATGLSGDTGERIAETVQIKKSPVTKAGRTFTLAMNPAEWLAKRGISGSLESMYAQVANIKDSTVKIVDDLLARSGDKHKFASADRFLDEVKSAYGKVADDIVEGVDISKRKSTILDAQGKPLSVVEEFDVPYKHKEPIFVPLKNLSQEIEQRLAEIKTLAQKSKTEGLTLTEMNKVKRIGDRVLNIYDRSGDVKAGVIAEKLSGLRSEIRGFIEDTAKKKGIPDVKELNQQTQMSLLIEKNFEKALSKIDTGSALGDQIILLMGLSGSAVSGGLAPLLGSAAVVGGREIARTHKIRSFMSNRFALMADGDYQTLLRGVETGKKSKKFFQILRREKQHLQKAFPELRLAGVVREKKQEIDKRIPIQPATTKF